MRKFFISLFKQPPNTSRMADDPSRKLIESAAPILRKAVTYDNANKGNDALAKYIEGSTLLNKAMSLLSMDDPRRTPLRAQLDSYLARAELLQSKCKIEVKILEQRRVEANSTGHGYDKIFTKCCDDKLKSVSVQDAYIVAHHQLLNFVRFCELIVGLSRNLRVISLKTGEDAKTNENAFKELGASLEKHEVILRVQYSSSVHDREITFDNGWIVKIGRGLDYFKPPSGGKYVLGACDMNLRPCHETTIDIFKQKK